MDLLVVGLACVLAWWIREQAFAGGGIYGPASSTPLELYREVFAITAAVCLVSFHTFGLYSASKSLLNVEEYKAVAKSSVVSFFVVLVLLFFLRETNATTDGGGIYAPFLWLHKEFELKVNPDYLSRVTLLLSFVFIMLMTIVSRFCSFRVIQRLHERGIGNRNVLVVGAGWTGRKLQEKFLHVPTLGLNFIGFVDDDEGLVGSWIGRGQVLGTVKDLKRVVGERKVGEVFISLPETKESEVLEICSMLDEMGTPYFVVPRFYHLMSYNVRIENLDSIPLITRRERSESLMSLAVKRAFDVIVSGTVLALSLPALIAFAVLIKRESAGPVFFRQRRIGLGGRPFEMIKFRTMHIDECGDAVAPKNENDPRVTRFGRWLRRYSPRRAAQLPQRAAWGDERRRAAARDAVHRRDLRGPGPRAAASQARSDRAVADLLRAPGRHPLQPGLRPLLHREPVAAAGSRHPGAHGVRRRARDRRLLNGAPRCTLPT